jgi:HSP20 family protein
MTQGDSERSGQRRGGALAVMDDVDDMMDRMLTGWPWMRRAYHRVPRIWRTRGWAPDIDVFDRDNNIVVRADLPGVKREDVDVSIEENVLTIRGSRKEETEVKAEDYYRMERAFGEFSRSMPVPQGIRPEDIQATFKDGVLEVAVPKPAEAQRKQVKVEVK